MPAGPSARDKTARNSEHSTAEGIEGNHARQHERQDDGGSATLPVALGAYEDDFRNAEENSGGEERSAGLREPKPIAEPSPVASQQSHAWILGQGNERHLPTAGRRRARSARVTRPRSSSVFTSENDRLERVVALRGTAQAKGGDARPTTLWRRRPGRQDRDPPRLTSIKTTRQRVGCSSDTLRPGGVGSKRRASAEEVSPSGTCGSRTSRARG